MRYGYYMPTRGPLSEPDAIGEMVGPDGQQTGILTLRTGIGLKRNSGKAGDSS